MSLSTIRPVNSLAFLSAGEIPARPAAGRQLELRGGKPYSAAPPVKSARGDNDPRTGDSPRTTAGEESAELQEAFQQFVGETFFGSLLAAMRKTVSRPAYFHGGRAEEAFQAQLDQTLAERMAQSTAETFSQPLLDLFTLARSQ